MKTISKITNIDLFAWKDPTMERSELSLWVDLLRSVKLQYWKCSRITTGYSASFFY